VLYNTCEAQTRANKTKEGIILKKADFIKAVAAKAGTTQKEADAVVAAALGTLKDTLKKDDSVAFLGFGTFSVKHRDARQGRNPATGEAMEFAASDTPVFKAGKAFKEKVNG